MDSINDILSSLTADDIDALKSMADSLFSSDSANGSDGSAQQSGGGFGDFLTPDMLIKLSSVMNIMNSAGNEKYRLIEALKPNLSLRRRQKADEAMQILKLFEILPLLTDLSKSGDNNKKL